MGHVLYVGAHLLKLYGWFVDEGQPSKQLSTCQATFANRTTQNPAHRAEGEIQAGKKNRTSNSSQVGQKRKVPICHENNKERSRFYGLQSRDQRREGERKMKIEQVVKVILVILNLTIEEALIKAAANGYQRVMKLLVNAGADPNTRDENGKTPLDWAAEMEHQEAVKLLVEMGADPNARNEYGYTPLHWAARNGHQKAVKFLVDAGADPKAKDKNGQTSLHLAAKKGHQEVVELLVNEGADPNTRDEDGWTPLHWATANGHQEMVKFLVNAGADLNARDEDDRTPLYLAATNQHQEVVEFLKRHLNKPNP